MDRLWTPWRMQYVTGADEPEGPEGRAGIFLDALADADNPDSLVVHIGTHGFVIMNLFPYNTGHMMVVPKRRVADLTSLSEGERAELFELVSETTAVAETVLNCDGFNIGLNIGSVAGAGIAQHLHIHVVPRWLGDANFMPITANTMVLPELLPATTARMKGEFTARTTRRHSPGIHSTSGSVVYLPDEKKFVLRVSQDGSVVLPKGHIEEGESAADAAIREVSEETGFASTITNWLGVDEYDYQGSSFHTTYFFAVGAMTPDVEAHLGTDTVLVDIDIAADKLTFPALTRIAERAIELVGRSKAERKSAE
ncbi:MAG: HIT domain-containing protein [Thermomicrobiales bacterium]